MEDVIKAVSGLTGIGWSVFEDYELRWLTALNLNVGKGDEGEEGEDYPTCQ